MYRKLILILILLIPVPGVAFADAGSLALSAGAMAMAAGAEQDIQDAKYASLEIALCNKLETREMQRVCLLKLKKKYDNNSWWENFWSAILLAVALVVGGFIVFEINGWI